MIDWYILLAPLVVLPIILLFVFVGCPATGIDEVLFPPALQLRYRIEQLTPAITDISATYTVQYSSGGGYTFPAAPSGTLTYSQGVSENALQALVLEGLPSDESFICSCQVDTFGNGKPLGSFFSLPAPKTTGDVRFVFDNTKTEPLYYVEHY